MTDTSRTFADLGVDASICEALAEKGIATPFPIQELTLPLALSRADVIGQARTGTGKTLAFGIPLLQAVDTQRNSTQALVIVPTRELCLQVHGDITAAGRKREVSTAAIYGGKAIEAQSSKLVAGAHVVVGTPGRLLDLKRRGHLDLSQVSTLVLDEADEMLDMGFLPDVEQLIEACGSERQTLLFSATMPGEVVGLARRYMNKPTFMRADVEEPQIAPETRQIFLACHRLDKPAVLARILSAPGRGLCVVFTRTKRMADVLVAELAQHGVIASAIHSNLRQDARERTLERFRKGKVDVLCATEVAARGLDISDVTHVVNYDCPDDEKMYLHRIGRTGRAGAAGVAVTLVVWNEQARLEMIKKGLGIDAPTHEVFSTSAELDELFDLPPKQAAPGRGTATGEGGNAPAKQRKRDGSKRSKQTGRDRGQGAASREQGRDDRDRRQGSASREQGRDDRDRTGAGSETGGGSVTAPGPAGTRPAAAQGEPADAGRGPTRTRRRSRGRGRGGRRDSDAATTAGTTSSPSAAPEEDAASGENGRAADRDARASRAARARHAQDAPAERGVDADAREASDAGTRDAVGGRIADDAAPQAPADESARSTGRAPADPGGAPDRERRRVRRRASPQADHRAPGDRKGSTSGRASEEQGADGHRSRTSSDDAAVGPDGPSPRSPRRQGRPRADRASSPTDEATGQGDGQERATSAATGRAKDDDEADTTRARSSRRTRSRGRSRQHPDPEGHGPAAGQQRQGRQGTAGPGQRAAGPDPQGADEARGNGQPALARPMTITHLP